MTEAAKEARKAYRRKWAAEHPENIRAYQERYWLKKAAEAAAQQPESKEEKAN